MQDKVQHRPPVSSDKLKVKAPAKKGVGDYKLGKSGRITHPMYLPVGADRYQEITWQEAFDKIGDQLKSYEDPNEAIFYTSGRTSNEAAFLYGLFVRMYGTNNLPDCSNMCHESSGKGLSETVGRMGMYWMKFL